MAENTVAPAPVSAQGTAERQLRADARRNRDLLMTTAAEVFGERGADAALEEIARRAGVGIGTLYRHFPTRDELIEAVYRREVELLCDGVDDLLRDYSAFDALAMWMRRFVEYVAKKRGMAMALKAAVGADSELFTYSHRRIHDALDVLIGAAVKSGQIREDVDAEDVLGAIRGICMANDTPGWIDRTMRLIDLLIDGLRYGAREATASVAHNRATDSGTAMVPRKSGAAVGTP